MAMMSRWQADMMPSPMGDTAQERSHRVGHREEHRGRYDGVGDEKTHKKIPASVRGLLSFAEVIVQGHQGNEPHLHDEYGTHDTGYD